MNIPPAQVAEKRKIGKLGKDPVWMISLVGGLNLCVIGSQKPEIAGISPHPAVSKHIAQKKFPSMQLDFAKNEDLSSVQLLNIKEVVNKYEILTEQIIKLQHG